MRKQPRQARSRATTSALLDATSRILAAKGWNALTTNEIASVAGASIGSLYQYFPDKLAIVGAIHDRHCAQLLAAVTEATGRDRRGARIARLVDTMIELHRREPRSHRVLMEDVPRRDDTAFEGAYQAAWQALVSAHAPACPSPASAACVLSHALAAAMHAAAERPQIDRRALREALVDLIDGFLRRLRASARSVA